MFDYRIVLVKQMNMLMYANYSSPYDVWRCFRHSHQISDVYMINVKISKLIVVAFTVTVIDLVLGYLLA